MSSNRIYMGGMWFPIEDVSEFHVSNGMIQICFGPTILELTGEQMQEVKVIDTMKDFKEDLRAVINKHGIDNMCNTPDYVLAFHLSDHALNFARATELRDKWFGHDPRKTFIPEGNSND